MADEKKPATVSDEEADRTGATLTPEQIAKGEDGSEESPKADDTQGKSDGDEPTEEKPDESDKSEEKPENKEPEGDKKPDDGDEKPEDTEDKPEHLQPKPKRSIYDDLKDKKKEVKEHKSEIETLKTQLAEKDQAIADLTKKAQGAETPEEKQEVEDEIKAIAEDIGADPEGIAKLTEFLSKKLVKPAGEQISKEDLEAIKNFRQSQAQTEATQAFVKEWNEFAPSLKKEFPHVTDQDLEVVRQVVDKLAHTEKYHDKEIDYIYFKEKEKLSKLISPKRPSYEGGESRPANESGDADVELSEKSSPLDVQNATSKTSKSSLEIRPSQ